MTYDEILKACIERAPDDSVLQDAFDELIYLHVGTDKRASGINNAGAEHQVDVLKEKGYTTERIVVEIAEQLALSPYTLGKRVSSPSVPVVSRKSKPAPVLKRVRFVYEVLCRVENTEIERMGLADIQMACEQGDCSGHFVETSNCLLSRRQAKLACEEHDTDLDFFEIPEFPVGTRVWWTDPDAGACSDYGTVVKYDGAYTLRKAGGGEVVCPGDELSLKKPKKGRKS